MEIAQLGFEVDTRGLVRGKKGLDDLESSGEKAEKRGLSLGKALGAIGFGALAVDTFKAASSMQSMNASLKTVLGSAGAAGSALKEIKEFAKTTPFDLEQSVQGFIKLKALGLDPSIASLRSYGNTASAMGKSLNQAVEAVADAATGEFERLKEFGIKAKSQGDLVTFTFQGVATTVKKEARSIEGYLQSIGNNNFGGAMADQMGTLGAQTSNLRGAFFELQLAFTGVKGEGRGLASAAGDSIQSLTKLLESDGAIRAVEMLGSAFTGVIDGLLMAVTGVSELYSVFAPLMTQFANESVLFAPHRAFVALFNSANDTVGAIDVLKGVFSDTQIVGIALVRGLLVGLENIKTGAQIAGAGFKFAFFSAFDLILEANAKMVKGLAQAFEFIGLDGFSRDIDGFANSISGALDPAKEFNNRIDELTKNNKLATAGIIKLTDEMADEAIKSKALAKVTGEVSTASNIAKKSFEGLGESVGQTKAEMKAAEIAAKALARATGTDLLRSQTQLNDILDKADLYTKNYSKALGEAKKALIDRGLVSGTKEYNKALESLGFQTEKAGESTSKLGALWERTTDSMYGAMEGFFYDGLSGWDSFADSIKDTFKKLIASVLAQWAASGIAGLFNGDGFSGFSVSGAFGNGSSNGGGLAQLFAGSGGGNSTLGQAGNAYGGAVGAYNSYNQIDQGLERGGTEGYLSAAISAWKVYQNGAKAWASASALLGSSASGGAAAIESFAVLQSNLATLNASISALPATVNATAAGFEAAATASNTATIANNANAASATSGATAGASAAAIWIAAGLLIDNKFNDGRATTAFGQEHDQRYEGVKSLFDGDVDDFVKSVHGGFKTFLTESFAARTFEEIAQEDYLSELMGRRDARGIGGAIGFNGGNIGVFGGNEGNTKAGLTAIHMADGGENGSVTYFTGAQESIDAMKAIAEEAGFATQAAGSFLEINSGAESIEKVKSLWSAYNDGLESAISASDIFRSNYSSGLINAKNSLFQNLNLATGLMADKSREAILLMDKNFDSLVSKGADSSEALLLSFSEAFSLSGEESAAFFESSGLGIDHWVSQLTNASDEGLAALTDFNHQGITQFEALNQAIGGASEMLLSQMPEAAHLAASSFSDLSDSAMSTFGIIQGGISDVRGEAYLASRDLENARRTSVAVQAQAQNTQSSQDADRTERLISAVELNSQQQLELMRQQRNA